MVRHGAVRLQRRGVAAIARNRHWPPAWSATPLVCDHGRRDGGDGLAPAVPTSSRAPMIFFPRPPFGFWSSPSASEHRVANGYHTFMMLAMGLDVPRPWGCPARREGAGTDRRHVRDVDARHARDGHARFVGARRCRSRELGRNAELGVRGRSPRRRCSGSIASSPRGCNRRATSRTRPSAFSVSWRWQPAWRSCSP